MEDQVRDVVEQFAAPLRERTGVIDMIAEYTNPIPNAVISRITGISLAAHSMRRTPSKASDASFTSPCCVLVVNLLS